MVVSLSSSFLFSSMKGIYKDAYKIMRNKTIVSLAMDMNVERGRKTFFLRPSTTKYSGKCGWHTSIIQILRCKTPTCDRIQLSSSFGWLKLSSFRSIIFHQRDHNFVPSCCSLVSGTVYHRYYSLQLLLLIIIGTDVWIIGLISCRIPIRTVLMVISRSRSDNCYCDFVFSRLLRLRPFGSILRLVMKIQILVIVASAWITQILMLYMWFEDMC